MPRRLIGDKRLIIVLGMARSGTTIFTHTLATHPSIYLHGDGSEAFVLENECLKTKNLDQMQRILHLHRDVPYVLLKRPWQEKHYAWFKTHLPAARYFICLRNRDDVIESWRTTGKWAVRDHVGVRINASSYYRQFKAYALIMRRLFGRANCMIVRYADVIHNKVATFRTIADWLNLDYQFSLERIRPGGTWENVSDPLTHTAHGRTTHVT